MENISELCCAVTVRGTTRVFILAAAYFLSAHLPLSAAGLGGCGSTWKQRLAIPEYACFSLAGGVLPYAACAAGAVAGYKPVYFGAACQQHDNCYSSNGKDKSACDRDFRALLEETCDYTLDGKFRNRARKTCRNAAAEFYYQVKERGCGPFKKAQKNIGNEAASCD